MNDKEKRIFLRLHKRMLGAINPLSDETQEDVFRFTEWLQDQFMTKNELEAFYECMSHMDTKKDSVDDMLLQWNFNLERLEK